MSDEVERLKNEIKKLEIDIEVLEEDKKYLDIMFNKLKPSNPDKLDKALLKFWKNRTEHRLKRKDFIYEIDFKREQIENKKDQLKRIKE
jgi:hypothetical protein